MSDSDTLTLRVQCSEGTWRVAAKRGWTLQELETAIVEELRLRSCNFMLSKERGQGQPLPQGCLRELGLAHGDMLYLTPLNGATLFNDTADETAESSSKPASVSSELRPSKSSSDIPQLPSGLEEDELDILLYKSSGNIERERDEKLCGHGPRGRCVHCAPLEPWDERHLEQNNIRHMSFHAHLRQLLAGSSGRLALTEPGCRLQPCPARTHEPWPRGICSRCQPGAVALRRQRYRHVDNVVLQSGAIVERFLAFWRASGRQRAALLLGRYEPHPDVPLGVRARVLALYEPPQECGRDHIALLDDPLAPRLERITKALGWRPVGWIFTDLLPLDRSKGTVKHTRGADSYFLSAQECITAAHFQNQHRLVCRHARGGLFGSRFVTVLASGDAEHSVRLDGYQVSDQFAALQRDDVLLPTKDAPDLAYVKPSTNDMYVADVFYKEKDEYGNEVPVSARRLPLAYVLVDVPCGVGAPPASSAQEWTCPFPPAHRALQTQLQTLPALEAALAAAPNMLAVLGDIHVLLFLASNDALALDDAALLPLLEAVKAGDEARVQQWADEEPAFNTLRALAQHAQHEPTPTHSSEALWTCPHCTFHNAPHNNSCDMCALPRGDAM